MKRAAIVCMAILLTVVTAGPLFAQRTDEEIMQAFTYTFQIFFLTSIQSAFGVAIPGVAIDDTGMTFTDFLLPEMEGNEGMPYTTFTGRIETRNEDDIHADLVLSGGPVKKLQWDLFSFSMEEDFEISITADGRKIGRAHV